MLGRACSWLSAEQGCCHCIRCFASSCGYVEVQPAPCTVGSSTYFGEPCRCLSAEQGCYQCSRSCAIACCYVEVTKYFFARRSSKCPGSLANASQPSRDPISAAGAVPLLVALLRSNQADLQQAARRALDALAVDS